MRYFCIEAESKPVAVVFHDYRNGSCYCRSKSEAFRRAFDAACSKTTLKFSREEDAVRARQQSPSEFGWIDTVLDQLCTGPWKIGESQNLQNIHEEVDSVIRNYLIQ